MASPQFLTPLCHFSEILQAVCVIYIMCSPFDNVICEHSLTGSLQEINNFKSTRPNQII